ncbi:MAG: multicopper oxidase domain-containing protein [Gallionella sp.]|jgi:FtsP/CotA-like multicopper oxidase with cupredoxin domain|nr:multicopper oxidase domain-containing protein [Gallionella sp.]MCK9353550.1 multicopper oxidase domain-containing protein [Gallionella sp.]
MNKLLHQLPQLLGMATSLLLLSVANVAWAAIDGISGPVFNLTAKADYISTADGGSLYAWGYANGNGTMQYPGPTMIVNQGDTVTINLSNELPVPVSIVLPGQQGIVSSGGGAGIMTQEAAAMAGSVPGTVSYTFTATQPGTYLYHSGTQPSLQVEMGLLGALIVRPSATDPLHQAYGHAATNFDHEYLFLLTEMDPAIHDQVLAKVTAGGALNVDTSAYHPVLWFMNGRNAPDTLLAANVPWLPTQPYNCLPRMHPGEKLLMRVVNAGRDLHPLHTHGNNFTLLARDGRLLESVPGIGPDLATSDFTLRSVPGETYDAIFEWTGKNLGWDIYGHTSANDPLAPNEYAPDHGKPIPVVLPNLQDVSFGAHYSGSPYLGSFGALPPGGTMLNGAGGYFHMWHSHNELEIVNNDIFPGGMMTMLIIEPAGTPIP